MGRRHIQFAVYLVLFVCLLDVGLSVAGRDFYGILGLRRDASESDIKKAYRKLTMKYHPDKNPGDKEMEQKYAEVNEVYEALSDPEKKQMYDQYGEEALKQGGGQQQGNPFGGGGGFPFGGPQFFRNGDGSFSFSFDPFGQQQRGPRKSQSIEMELLISLADVYMGAEYEVKQFRPDGSSETHTLDVERGMSDGDRIVLSGVADKRTGEISGDVIYHVRVMGHPLFERSGFDLKITLELPLLQALVGFETVVRHLDGHEVVIKRDQVSKHDAEFVIEHEGLPHRDFPSQRGNLIVKTRVTFPDRINAQQAAGLRQHLSGL